MAFFILPRELAFMPLRHLILALLVILIWGFNFVVIKIGLQDISPLLLCALRFFLAAFPAIFFIKPPQAPFKLVAAYALITFFLQFSCLFVGMYLGMPAGLASLVLQTHVFFTILLAVLFLGEAPNRLQIMGALIAFAGIGMVAINMNLATTMSGFVLILGAAVSWGLGNFILKKMGKINMLSLIVWGSVIALPPFVLLSVVVEGVQSISSSFHHISLLSALSVIYIVYASTWFGYGVWNWLMSQYPVTSIAPFTLLIPIVGMISSSLVLGEEIESWKIGAGLLVLLGVSINLLGPWLASSRDDKVIADLQEEVAEAGE